MMLGRICWVVERMWNYLLDRIIHRWIGTIKLSIELLNAISIVGDVKLAHPNVFQPHGILQRFTFHAVTWKSFVNVRARCCLAHRSLIRTLPAVNT